METPSLKVNHYEHLAGDTVILKTTDSKSLEERIRIRYKMNGVFSWDVERYNRLCKAAGKSQKVMAALVGARWQKLRGQISLKMVSESAAIHLAILESFYREIKTGKREEPIMPIDMK